MRLALDAVRAGYGKQRVVGVTEPLSLAFREGEFTAVLGPNGSGKSTSLRIAAGLHRPEEGRALLGDRPVRALARKELARSLAFVQQSPAAPPGATVRELVALGRHAHLGWHGRWSPGDRSAVDSAMARCGVAGFADRGLSTLSGGEQQRAWIALAVAQQPRVLLLDEPIAALDVRHQLDVLGLIAELCVQDGTTAVVVLHDLNIAARFADRLVAMRAGSVVADGTPADVMTPETVARVFDVRAEVRTDGPSGRPWCVPLESLATS